MSEWPRIRLVKKPGVAPTVADADGAIRVYYVPTIADVGVTTCAELNAGHSMGAELDGESRWTWTQAPDEFQATFAVYTERMAGATVEAEERFARALLTAGLRPEDGEIRIESGFLDEDDDDTIWQTTLTWVPRAEA